MKSKEFQENDDLIELLEERITFIFDNEEAFINKFGICDDKINEFVNCLQSF